MTTNTIPNAFVVSGNSATITVNGRFFTIDQTHPNYTKILDALQVEDWATVATLVDLQQQVADFLSGDAEVSYVGGDLIHKGVKFDSQVTALVLKMIKGGAPKAPLFSFLKKVRENPSYSAQTELLLFLAANDFMIFEDGDLLAYKKVRPDYKDYHSGSFDNSIGQIVAMQRGQVNDNREVTCSHGLHFAAYEYAKNFGDDNGHLMVLKIHPADVVSIPVDYQNQKGRCCKYVVVGERTDAMPVSDQPIYKVADVQGRTRSEFTREDVKAKVLQIFEQTFGFAGTDSTETFDDLDVTRSGRARFWDALKDQRFGPVTVDGEMLEDAAFEPGFSANDTLYSVIEAINDMVANYYADEDEDEDFDDEEDAEDLI